VQGLNIKGFALTLAMACGALTLTSCGNGNDGFVAPNAVQKTIHNGIVEFIELAEGQRADFPGDTFAEDTVVTLSNFFAGGDADITLFPTTTPVAEDLLASLVLNTPADAVFGNDVTVTFRIHAGIANLTPGDDYVVYRFDFENARWNQWGSVTATVAANGTDLVAVLPTDGMLGFIGSLAVFEGLEAGAVLDTEISGTVVDGGGAGIATDVSLYVLVGELRVAVAVSNGRVPDALDPHGAPIVVANTVDSAASGSFSMELPDNLIGQTVAIVFAAEDDTRTNTDEFDLLAPGDSTASDELRTTMVVRYGENNVRSAGVI
jgi:hypothetical protein